MVDIRVGVLDAARVLLRVECAVAISVPPPAMYRHAIGKKATSNRFECATVAWTEAALQRLRARSGTSRGASHLFPYVVFFFFLRSCICIPLVLSTGAAGVYRVNAWWQASGLSQWCLHLRASRAPVIRRLCRCPRAYSAITSTGRVRKGERALIRF